MEWSFVTIQAIKDLGSSYYKVALHNYYAI